MEITTKRGEPACPLDHQTAGALARALERAGVPTLVVAGARDIVQAVRPPRTVYVHAPLGWLLGTPHDQNGQDERLTKVLHSGFSMTRSGGIVDLEPKYPFGADSVPALFDNEELDDWEHREFARGYITGGRR